MAKSKFERLPGFRDFPPEELGAIKHIFDAWRTVSNRYGFTEYGGPPLELLDLYVEKSGPEIVNQLYNFADKGQREVSLRPEMTPSLARILAGRHRAMPKPIRWFSIPQLFRYERQQKGRLREHFQWNVDIVGEEGVNADAEVLAVGLDGLRELGLTHKDIVARVSDRKLMAEMFLVVGVLPEFISQVFSIIDKINSSEAPVRARLDPIRDSIDLETTFPHQLWPEDIVGTVLSDLGVLEYPSEGNRVSSDLASSARVFGGSAFEMVILVRDNLFVGDHEQVGSSGIRGIDQALDNVISTLAEVGSKANRINLAQERILFELPERIATNDLQVGLDLAEAITDLKSLETAHQAALQATARSLSPSLMEFLR